MFFLTDHTRFWKNVLNSLFMEQIHGNKIRESAQYYFELMTISFCNADKTLTINLLRTKFPSNSNIGTVKSILLAGTILDFNLTKDTVVLQIDVTIQQ